MQKSRDNSRQSTVLDRDPKVNPGRLLSWVRLLGQGLVSKSILRQIVIASLSFNIELCIRFIVRFFIMQTLLYIQCLNKREDVYSTFALDFELTFCADIAVTFLMPESHERILRRISRRFGSFPTRTYSNRISNDANVRITYEERSGRVLNLNKTCA